MEQVLERFNMKNVKPVSTPLANHFKLSKMSCPTIIVEKEVMVAILYSSAIGSLMHAMVCTRLDIAYVVEVVSRFLSNLGNGHWEAMKWILRYLKGTCNKCLCFGGAEPTLEGYTNVDMASDMDGRKSTLGILFTFAGGAISRQSKLQKCVALLTTKAGKKDALVEEISSIVGNEARKLCYHCDRQSALDLSKNVMYHSCIKHIDVRYRWLWQEVEEQHFKLKKIHTDKNLANMMIKVVEHEKLQLYA